MSWVPSQYVPAAQLINYNQLEGSYFYLTNRGNIFFDVHWLYSLFKPHHKKKRGKLSSVSKNKTDRRTEVHDLTYETHLGNTVVISLSLSLSVLS